MVLANNHVEDILGHEGKHEHHQCADDCAREHAERERRITFQVTKNAPDGFHSRLARLVSAGQLMTVKSPHSSTYTRFPECLCRSLNVSSARPDLSSSPNPSLIIASYCCLVD